MACKTKSKANWFAGCLGLILLCTISSCQYLPFLEEQRSAYDAIAEETPIFFEFKDPGHLFQKIGETNYGSDLANAGFYAQLLDEFQSIDSAFKLFNPETEILASYRILIAAAPTHADELDFLFVLELGNQKRFSVEEFALTLKSAYPNQADRIFRDQTIYECNINPEKEGFKFANVEGLLIGSFTSFLLEDAIVQLTDRESILLSPEFSKIHQAAGKNFDCTAFVNLNFIDLMAPLLLNSEHQGLLSKTSQIGDWAEIEFLFKKDEILTYGYVSTEDSTEKILHWLDQTPRGNMALLSQIPRNVACVYYHSVEDFNKFIEEDYRVESLAPELEPYFKDWVGKEWAFFVTQSHDEVVEDNSYLVVEITDQKLASENLAELATLASKNPKYSEHWGTTISKVHSNSVVNQAFGQHFVKLADPWYFVRNGYLFFSSDLSSAKQLLESLTSQNSLVIINTTILQ